MRAILLGVSKVGPLVAFFTLILLALLAAPAASHHMEGFVYCDANSSGGIDAGDMALAGVCVNVVSTDAATSVDDTDCTAVDGSYYVPLPSIRPANYRATLVSGLPGDAVFVIPPVNNHSFLIQDGHTTEVFDWLIDSRICHVCGNGVVEYGEICDDGNNISGDGCEPDCTPTPICGDGIVGNTPGETCDPPHAPAGASGNPCRADCTVCGDGVVQPGEACDDGNNISGDGCEPDCTQVCDDRKTDFTISLTPKEKFVWMSSQPYDQRGNQIQAYNGETGYMFCWAINNEYDQLEIPYNRLKGDATVIGRTGSAFNYNAIPSQALKVVPDKTLHLDGYEYTAGPGQIMVEGLAGIPGAIQGTLAVVNPGIDFVHSIQPEFNINLTCWNEVESKYSRHVHFKDFEQYDLTKDLQLDLAKIFTLGWHCAATSTHAMWAVLHQNLTPVFQWGASVWQHPESCVPSTISLPGGLGINGMEGSNIACNNVHEPGSLLVYPLIDNLNANTIVNIANTGDEDVVLECYMVSAPCRP